MPGATQIDSSSGESSASSLTPGTHSGGGSVPASLPTPVPLGGGIRGGGAAPPQTPLLYRGVSSAGKTSYDLLSAPTSDDPLQQSPHTPEKREPEDITEQKEPPPLFTLENQLDLDSPELQSIIEKRLRDSFNRKTMQKLILLGKGSSNTVYTMGVNSDRELKGQLKVKGEYYDFLALRVRNENRSFDKGALSMSLSADMRTIGRLLELAGDETGMPQIKTILPTVCTQYVHASRKGKKDKNPPVVMATTRGAPIKQGLLLTSSQWDSLSVSLCQFSTNIFRLCCPSDQPSHILVSPDMKIDQLILETAGHTLRVVDADIESMLMITTGLPESDAGHPPHTIQKLKEYMIHRYGLSALTCGTFLVWPSHITDSGENRSKDMTDWIEIICKYHTRRGSSVDTAHTSYLQFLQYWTLCTTVFAVSSVLETLAPRRNYAEQMFKIPKDLDEFDACIRQAMMMVQKLEVENLTREDAIFLEAIYMVYTGKMTVRSPTMVSVLGEEKKEGEDQEIIDKWEALRNQMSAGASRAHHVRVITLCMPTEQVPLDVKASAGRATMFQFNMKHDFEPDKELILGNLNAMLAPMAPPPGVATPTGIETAALRTRGLYDVWIEGNFWAQSAESIQRLANAICAKKPCSLHINRARIGQIPENFLKETGARSKPHDIDILIRGTPNSTDMTSLVVPVECLKSVPPNEMEFDIVSLLYCAIYDNLITVAPEKVSKYNGTDDAAKPAPIPHTARVPLARFLAETKGRIIKERTGTYDIKKITEILDRFKTTASVMAWPYKKYTTDRAKARPPGEPGEMVKLEGEYTDACSCTRGEWERLVGTVWTVEGKKTNPNPTGAAHLRLMRGWREALHTLLDKSSAITVLYDTEILTLERHALLSALHDSIDTQKSKFSCRIVTSYAQLALTANNTGVPILHSITALEQSLKELRVKYVEHPDVYKVNTSSMDLARPQKDPLWWLQNERASLKKRMAWNTSPDELKRYEKQEGHSTKIYRGILQIADRLRASGAGRTANSIFIDDYHEKISALYTALSPIFQHAGRPFSDMPVMEEGT